jgi:hypothetical protein
MSLDAEILWGEFGLKLYGSDDLFDMMKNDLDILKFDGFKPREFFGYLVEIANKKKISEKDFKEHMFTAISWAVLRGSSTKQKNIDRTTKEGKKKIKDVIELYGIKPSQPKSATDVTIGRIAATFPQMLAGVISKLDPAKQRVVGSKDKSFPAWLCFPSAAALIPFKTEETDETKADWDKVWAHWFEWACSFDLLVNDAREGRLKPDPERVLSIASAIRNSDQFSNSVRAGYLKLLKLDRAAVSKLPAKTLDDVLKAAMEKAKKAEERIEFRNKSSS